MAIEQSAFHKRSAAFQISRTSGQLSLPLSAQSLDWNGPISLVKVLQSGHPLNKIKGTCCGIYFLIEGFEVVYIGRSVNVSARLSEHREDPGMIFSEAAIMPCPENALCYLEPWLIASFQPKFNRTPKRVDVANVHRAIVGYAKMESASLRRLRQDMGYRG